MPTDPTYFSGWDKVGIIGILIAIIVFHAFLGGFAFKALKGLIGTVMDTFKGINEKSEESHKGTADVIHSNTQAAIQLAAIVDNLTRTTNALHMRMDNILQCPAQKCPVRKTTPPDEINSRPT